MDERAIPGIEVDVFDGRVDGLKVGAAAQDTHSREQKELSCLDHEAAPGDKKWLCVMRVYFIEGQSPSGRVRQ